jgi:hypothetical protein
MLKNRGLAFHSALLIEAAQRMSVVLVFSQDLSYQLPLGEVGMI